MAYNDRTVTNATLFDAAPTGLVDVFDDAGWTATASSATSFTISSTFNGETIRYQFTRANDSASDILIYLGTNTGVYTYYRTLPISTAAAYTGNVRIISSIVAGRAIVVLQTVSGSEYRNSILYLGGIDAFDSTDVNAWGEWASGASENRGSNYLAEGFPLNTKEVMLMRAMARETGQGATAVTAFQFAPILGDDAVFEYGYNGLGSNTNILASSASYTGNSLADIHKEQLYMGNRMARIGVYRKGILAYQNGLRGTLDGLYAVHPEWRIDSAGNAIPHVDTMDVLEATVLFDANGSVNFSNKTTWVVVPLSNSVYLREGLWIGPKVVTFPKL